MTVNWGVLGTGGIADRRTIPEGILQADGAKLVAVMDLNEGRAKQCGDKYQVDWYTSAEQLLARSDIHAVYVTTPVKYHYELVMAAARQGKHVLCEKPLAFSVDEAEQMITACQENRVKLGVGFMMRFHGAHTKLRDMVANGDLGQPVLARAQLTCWYPPMPGAWRQNPTLGGGGALIDMGTHCIDLLEMLFGPVERVMADVGTITHNYMVDDSAVVLLHFRNGAHGVVDSNFNIPDAAALNILEVYGTKGSVCGHGTIGQDAGGQLSSRLEQAESGYDAQQQRSSAVALIEFEQVNAYRAEVEDMVRSIHNDTRPTVDGVAGLHNMRVTLAAYDSARTGRCVRID